MVFLHGAGEQGEDNQLQLLHGSSLFLSEENRQKYPAVVVFPQCPTNSYWASLSGSIGQDAPFFENPEQTKRLKLVQGLIRELQSTYSIDKNRIYVGGLSMGGMGTFELVYRKPKNLPQHLPSVAELTPKPHVSFVAPLGASTMENKTPLFLYGILNVWLVP